MAKEILDISIVIGKNEKFIIPCLRSIFKETVTPFNIYVICNWKEDKIIRKIQKEFPDITLLINSEPKGFAENHNNVIKSSHSKYISILNDDTVILSRAIDKLIRYMEENPRVGVISPKLVNPDLSLQHSTYSFPSLFKDSLNIFGLRKLVPFNKLTYSFANLLLGEYKSRFWRHNQIAEVDTLRGACVLVRRETIEEVGLMDEVTLAYGEETEWHCRMKKKGWKIVFNPEVEVIHYGRQSSKSLGSAIELEQIKGLLNFYNKHKKFMEFALLRGAIFAVFNIKLFLSFIAHNQEKIKYYKQITKMALTPYQEIYHR